MPRKTAPKTPPQEAAIVTWAAGVSDDAKRKALQEYVGALGKVEPVVRRRPEHSQGSTVWRNVSNGPSGTSVRDGFDRQDYDDFRADEALPKTPKGCMRAALCIYKDVGLVRNVIDLMSDFVVKGVGLEHPSPDADSFYKEWWRRVQGYEVSNAFAKQLCLLNNVLPRRHTARLSRPAQRQWDVTSGEEKDGGRTPAESDVSLAEPDAEYEKDPAPRAREIPLRYSFLNPTTVDLLDEEAAPFIGPSAYRFAVRIPENLIRRIRYPKEKDDQALVAALPRDLVQAVRRGDKHVKLDPDKVSVFHYKKDDWEPWATPFLRSVMGDLQTLQKMKLADLAALDGIISSIRIWKVGSLEPGHEIYPPEAVLNRLANMLTSNVGGGVMDLVWGPDIELQETSTSAHQFLGDTKYGPVLNLIFQGLGIPPTLNGTGQRPGSGFTNNYMSLKVFAERLEYVRSVLRRFWEGELRRVQKAMGHRRPASLFFDTVLTDESQMMLLYLHMADRDLISFESVQEIFGLNSEVERVRLRKEMNERKKRRIPVKSGPFHSPNLDVDLAKIFAQTGAYAPAEFGLELHEPEEKEEPPAEKTAKITKKYAPPPAPPSGGNPAKKGGKSGGTPGQPGQGRQPGQKDGAKRKQKAVKPRTASEETPTFVQALGQAQAQLADVQRLTLPLYLKALGKKTARELSEQEAAALEDFRFSVLCSLGPDEEPTESSLRSLLKEPLPPSPVHQALFRKTLSQHRARHHREPTAETARLYMAAVKACLACADEGDEEDEDEACISLDELHEDNE